MTEFQINMIGTAAAVCTTVCFFPQIVKILRSKHARDISLGMYVVLTLGVFLWLVYGIALRKFPIIFANGVTFFLCLVVLAAKIKYSGNGK